MSVYRFYITDTPSPVTPPRSGAWHPTITPSPSAARTLTNPRPGSTAPNIGGSAVQETLPGGANLLSLTAVTGLFGAGALAGSYRLAFKMSETGSTVDAFPRAILRVVSSDGTTTRGVLFDTTHATELTASTPTSRAFAGTLTTVTTQAGDRLVLELGAELRNTTGFAAGINFSSASYTAVDVPFVDGDTTASAVPWLELTLTDAPATAPAPTVTSFDHDTITLGWPAVAGASGYQVRRDGGAWSDIGNTTSHAFEPLTPATSYTFDVRAYNIAGTGPAGTVVASTASPPADAPVVTVAAATSDTVVVEWTAVAGATGYDVRLDAGAWLDAGTVLGWSFGELVSGSSYTIDVRAYNSAGDGPVGTVVAATDDPPAGYYRAAVEIAGRSWTATRDDVPGLGIALPLAFGWAMGDDAAGYPAQLEPATASLLLVVADGAELEGIDIGANLRVRVWLDPNPVARPFATFAGRVGDYEIAPHPHGIAARLLGVDYTVDLAARTVGNTVEWPSETGDARAERIMAENGQTGWTSATIGNTFEARAAQPASAYEALRETLTAAARFTDDDYSAPGRVILTPNVTEDGYLDADAFRGTFVPASSSAIDKIATAVHRSTSWLRNRITDGRWVHIDHPGGPSVYGRVSGQPRPRLAVPVYDTDALAQLALATVPGFTWQSGAPLRLDLSHPDAPVSAVREWFWRDTMSPAVPGAGRVVVVSVCDALPGMFTTYAGMLAAASLTLEPAGRLYIDFRLRPDVPAHSTVTPRWQDEPADATWLDEPADATWYELRTITREDYLA